MFNIFNIGVKRTKFLAGGLMPAKRMMSAQNTVYKSPRFIAPRKIDNRDLCIVTSDQGQTSMCAAYSTAGQIEVKNWKSLHYPEQIDPIPIYAEAKRLDGDSSDGTSLDNAAQAVINLKIYNGDAKFINKDLDTIRYAVHTNDIVVGGFLITDEWNLVKDGIITKSSGAAVLGGHAVLIVGYDEKGLYIQNSWGPNWGSWGFALIPWELVSAQFMYGMMMVPKLAA